jgi:putative transposase
MARSRLSESQLDIVRAYIRGQAEHHRTKTFADEYRAFLRNHGVAFDEKYLLG